MGWSAAGGHACSPPARPRRGARARESRANSQNLGKRKAPPLPAHAAARPGSRTLCLVLTNPPTHPRRACRRAGGAARAAAVGKLARMDDMQTDRLTDVTDWQTGLVHTQKGS